MNRYDRMKIICLFDLPTETNEEKRAYRVFRTALIKNGFVMMQYSVYVRTCPNREFAKKFVSKLKIQAPTQGNVRLIYVTEKQYDDMELIIGTRNDEEVNIGSKRIVVI